MLDIYFGGVTFGNYTYVKHELYVTPTIYEAIPINDDIVRVPKNENGYYDLIDLERKQIELFNRQMLYVANTTNCNSCKHLQSCVSRNVLSYMESRDMQNCFLPTKLFRDASRVIELENHNVN